MKAKGEGAEKGKKEEERGGETDLQWLLWSLTVVLAGGGGSKRHAVSGGGRFLPPCGGVFSMLFLFYCSHVLPFFLPFRVLFFFSA